MQIRTPLSNYHRQAIDKVHNKEAKQNKMTVRRQPRRADPINRRIEEDKNEGQSNKIPKKKKIVKKNYYRINMKKKEKQIVREENTQGKLLQQLTMIHDRADRMDREKDHYCLIDLKKNVKNCRYRFYMVKDDDPYILKIDVKNNYDTVCNCFDWRIRCRNFMIPCRHVFYVLKRILGYELYDYYDNRIMDKELFEKLVRDKLINRDQFRGEQRQGVNDKVCPVCFSDFQGCPIARTVECPDCTNVTHLDCANVWLEHSARKACAICFSDNWRQTVEQKNK